MSMNHRHALKIPVNEMSNTYPSKTQTPRPADRSAHLPAEPSPLNPDSTSHIYGKGGERKEYIFRGLYNSSFAHQSLSSPSPFSRRGLWLSSPSSPHLIIVSFASNKRKGSGWQTCPYRGHQTVPSHNPLHPLQLPLGTTTSRKFSSEYTAKRRAPKTCSYSTPGMSALPSALQIKYPSVYVGSKPP